MPTTVNLAPYREALADVEALMRGGIFTDTDTGREYFTGYGYKVLYDWDQYFEAIVQIYMGWPSTYIRNAVTIFLDHQQPSGHIARSVPSDQYHDHEHVKPFLAQTAKLVVDYYDELDWLAPYYDKLQKYYEYWVTTMAGANGLSEWMSAPHTGMDNQHARAGFWQDRISQGVDLNCYLVREARALAFLAERLGYSADATAYRAAATMLAERIRMLLWDEDDGFFYDLHARTGERIRVKSAASFAALWAKVATPEQAKRLIVEHLFNAAEFWTPYPIATLAKSEPGYSREKLSDDLGCNWRATSWAPTNYYICHGLRNYGYDQLASLVAAAFACLLRQSGNREWYDAETGEGYGMNPFWGWSLLGHFMEYEEQSEVDPTALE